MSERAILTWVMPRSSTSWRASAAVCTWRACMGADARPAAEPEREAPRSGGEAWSGPGEPSAPGRRQPLVWQSQPPAARRAVGVELPRRAGSAGCRSRWPGISAGSPGRAVPFGFDPPAHEVRRDRRAQDIQARGLVPGLVAPEQLVDGAHRRSAIDAGSGRKPSNQPSRITRSSGPSRWAIAIPEAISPAGMGRLVVGGQRGPPGRLGERFERGHPQGNVGCPDIRGARDSGCRGGPRPAGAAPRASDRSRRWRGVARTPCSEPRDQPRGGVHFPDPCGPLSPTTRGAVACHATCASHGSSSCAARGDLAWVALASTSAAMGCSPRCSVDGRVASGGGGPGRRAGPPVAGGLGGLQPAFGGPQGALRGLRSTRRQRLQLG